MQLFYVVGHVSIVKSPIYDLRNAWQGGDTWMLNLPDQSSESFALILKDASYAVWIGNARIMCYKYEHDNLIEEDDVYYLC